MFLPCSLHLVVQRLTIAPVGIIIIIIYFIIVVIWNDAYFNCLIDNVCRQYNHIQVVYLIIAIYFNTELVTLIFQDIAMNYVTVLLVIIAAELTWSLPVYHPGVASRVRRDISK